jgi:hypothetical protein
MNRKHIPSCWPLVQTPVPEPEPVLLTDAELAEVNKLFVPLDALIQHYIEDTPTWPYDAILEALARLTDYYESEETFVIDEIANEIAAEEADA